MRGDDHSGMVEERRVGRWRFLFEDIEGSAGDETGVEGLRERRFVDQVAAGNVDYADPGLELSKLLIVEEVAGAGRQDRVEGNDVTLGEDFILRSETDAEHLKALGPNARVIGNHVHVEAAGATGDLGADATEAK